MSVTVFLRNTHYKIHELLLSPANQLGRRGTAAETPCPDTAAGPRARKPKPGSRVKAWASLHQEFGKSHSQGNRTRPRGRVLKSCFVGSEASGLGRARLWGEEDREVRRGRKREEKKDFYH